MTRDVHRIDDKVVSKPLNSDNLTIEASFVEDTLAEVQPALSVQSLIWGTSGKDRILEQIRTKGRYQKIYYNYEYNGVNYLNAYLNEINYKLDRDQIETTLSLENDTNNLSGLLAAVNSDILTNDYVYTDLEVIVERINIGAELVQLSIATLTYLYILYNQALELVKAASDLLRAFTPSGPVPNFGDIAALVLNVGARATFFFLTLVQLRNTVRQIRELIIPKVRIAKTISLYELIRAPLELIGYSIDTNINDMFDDFYLERGELNRSNWSPRPESEVYTGLGALEFILKKYNAKTRISGDTIFIYQEFDDIFYTNSNYVIPSYFKNQFTENTDDQKGFRQIKYAYDPNDRYTEINYKGSDFVVIARPPNQTESTLKGSDIINMNVGLCTRKESLSLLEQTWISFSNVVNSVINAFNGAPEILTVSERIGAAIFDTDNPTIPRICRVVNGRIPSNHRKLLSAKNDYEKYYHTKSLVSNPRARYKLYTGDNSQLVRFKEDDLNKLIDNGYIYDIEGNRGKILNNIKWQADKDNTILEFRIEDVNREMKLIEEFREPDFQ